MSYDGMNSICSIAESENFKDSSGHILFKGPPNSFQKTKYNDNSLEWNDATWWDGAESLICPDDNYPETKYYKNCEKLWRCDTTKTATEIKTRNDLITTFLKDSENTIIHTDNHLCTSQNYNAGYPKGDFIVVKKNTIRTASNIVSNLQFYPDDNKKLNINTLNHVSIFGSNWKDSTAITNIPDNNLAPCHNNQVRYMTNDQLKKTRWKLYNSSYAFLGMNTTASGDDVPFWPGKASYTNTELESFGRNCPENCKTCKDGSGQFANNVGRPLSNVGGKNICTDYCSKTGWCGQGYP